MMLTFRPARSEDIPTVVALVQSAYRGETSRQGWTTEADLLEGQRVDAEMLTDVMARGDTVVVLAVRGDRVVGCCELTRPDEPGEAAHLGMFAVDPSAQGGGLGRQVLAEAERTVRDDWGVSQLQLHVLDVRAELIEWYGRRGYSPTGETDPFPYGDARYGVPLRDDLRLAVLAKPL